MHHTKTKGDLGLAKVIADLVSRGYVPCIPLSEHQPYDVVAVGTGGKVVKLQAKYAALQRNGIVEERFRRSWADRNGSHIQSYSRKEFDYYASYCPQQDIVLYVPNSKRCPKTIRFSDSANHQKKNAHWFRDYLDLL